MDSSSRTVTVNGTGRTPVSPDVVRVDLRIGHDARDVAAALAGAATGMTEVGRVIRELGVADHDIRTLDAGVSQRYDNTGTPVGFTAHQRLGVTIRELSLVGSVLEAAAGAVGNALLVDQVRLDVADPSEGLRRARDLAFADAEDKAQQYAAHARSELGAVLAVVEGGAVVPLGGSPRFARAAAAAEMSAPMPMEGGSLDLSAGVTVTWELR